MVRDLDRQTNRMPVLNPYEKRLRETDRKLRDALNRLVNGAPRDAALKERRHQFSVANPAREAGVARNAIYTNHRDMIEALRHAAQQRVVPSKLARQTRPAAGRDRGAEDGATAPRHRERRSASSRHRC